MRCGRGPKPPGQARRLTERQYFVTAFALFRIHVAATGRHKEALTEWESFLAELPPRPTPSRRPKAAQEPAEPTGGEAPPRRKKRTRSRKKKKKKAAPSPSPDNEPGERNLDEFRFQD